MLLRALLPLPFLALFAVGISAPDPPEAALAAVHAAVESSSQLRFVVVGDTQDDGTTGGGINDTLWPAMAEDMNALAPAFALFCGDLVAGSSNLNTTAAEWEDWKVATSTLGAIRYMVPGNHDMYGGPGTYARWTQAFPWLPTANSPAGQEGMSYWFDVGTTRIISVTTDLHTGGSAPNQAWLDGALASAAGMDHVFVFSHRPIQFSTSEPTGGSAGALWQSLVANDVSGYFSGHWHRYQPDRIGGAGLGASAGPYEVLIGTGGGWQGFEPIRPYQQVPGFLLVEVDGLQASASFYGDADGDGHFDDVLDSFVMKDASPPTQGLVAAYDFEAGSPVDGGQHGIDGAWRRNAEVVSGISGLLGLALDGKGDHVEAGAIGDHVLSLNADLTLGAFARYGALATGDWDNPLLCYATNDYYTENEETNYSYWLSLQSNRRLRAFWEYGDGNNVVVTSTLPAPVAPGEDHHYAITRDATAGEVRFYVDGVLLGSPVGFTQLPTGGGRGMLYLGSDTPAYHGSEAEFEGLLDDVTIHDRALTAAEVAILATPRARPALRRLWSASWETITAADWGYVDGVLGWSSETAGTNLGAWAGDSGWFANHTGSYALQAASAAGDAHGYTWKTLAARYEAGRRYLFTVHYRRRTGTSGPNAVGAYLYAAGDAVGFASNGAGARASSVRTEPGMQEAWHTLHCAYTATDADDGKAIVVQVHGDDSVLLDDLELSLLELPKTAR
ncbi:MAG: metallophosphoesterase [Planctomycetota bacterium]|nr:metallophosphoesterase [Planctomycetota bacterium]